MNIFDAAKFNQADDLKEALLIMSPDSRDAAGNTPLMRASYYNNLETAELLLQAGAFPDEVDSKGNTALMGACFKGFTALANKLLAGGANMEVRNGNGATALTFAATLAVLKSSHCCWHMAQTL